MADFSRTVVNTGATLQLNANGGVFQAETVVLNGTGFAGANLAGALVALQTNTLQGNIVLNPGTFEVGTTATGSLSRGKIAYRGRVTLTHV